LILLGCTKFCCNRNVQRSFGAHTSFCLMSVVGSVDACKAAGQYI
jgi:hypothetical protein